MQTSESVRRVRVESVWNAIKKFVIFVYLPLAFIVKEITRNVCIGAWGIWYIAI